MRVLITSVGSGGDVHPYIAIGRELARRGHVVEMLVNPHYRARVEGEGLGFRPLGTEEDYLAARDHPGIAAERSAPGVIVNELLLTTVRPTVRGVEESLQSFKPDVVVRHHISLGSRWVCEREGVAHVTGVLAPVFWLSRVEPPVLDSIFGAWCPRWLKRVRLSGGKRVFQILLDPKVNALRREFGFPTEKKAFVRESRSGRAVLGLWSARYRGTLADDPANGVICGFPFFDRAPGEEAAPEELRGFLRECEGAGRPPIVFTFGTLIAHHAKRLYEMGAEACRRLGRPGLLLIPNPSEVPGNLARDVRVFSYAPYSTVFPHAAAIVHHGGIGTTAQGLRAGNPMVVVPNIADQFDNGERCRALGVGRVVTRPTAERVTAAVREVLESAGAREAGEGLARAIGMEDGAGRAAEEVERCAAGGVEARAA